MATGSLRTVDYISRTTLSNLAGYPSLSVAIYGVEENYLDSTYTKFFQPQEISTQFNYELTSDNKPNVIKSLFTDAGKGTH